MSLDAVTYDPNAANRYLSDLNSPLPSLAVNEAQLAGVRIQPTIGPHVAALLDALIRLLRPVRILEIGTSFGYSAAVMGRAAQSCGGTVLTCEINPRLAEAARTNLRALGLHEVVTVHQGDAQALVKELAPPFGLILQDGDKMKYLPMLDSLVALLPPGGVLISDDVLFPVMNLPESARHWGDAMHEYNLALRTRLDLHTIWLPLGDGVAVSIKQ